MQARSPLAEGYELSAIWPNPGELLLRSERLREWKTDRGDGYLFWNEGNRAEKGQANGFPRRERPPLEIEPPRKSAAAQKNDQQPHQTDGSKAGPALQFPQEDFRQR